MSDLINEFKEKWKELTILILLCCVELYWFSSLVLFTPMFAVVIISIILLAPAFILLGCYLKSKNLDNKDKKVLCIFIIAALICGIARSYLFIMSLFIAYLFYDDRQKLYKWMFLISISGLILFITLCIFSVIPNLVIYRNDGDLITNIRHTFGFGHPNHVMKFYFCSIIWGYLWLCKDRKSTLIFTLISLPALAFLGYNSNCRTGVITILGLLVIMNFPILVKWIKTKWLYLLFCMITIAIISLQDFGAINSLFSGRPEWFEFFINEYTIYMLFGKCYIGIFNYPLDNGIMFTLFDGGIIAVILIAIIFYKAFENNENIKIKVAIIAILVYSMFEALSTIYINPLFILLFLELLKIYFKVKNINLTSKDSESSQEKTATDEKIKII